MAVVHVHEWIQKFIAFIYLLFGYLRKEYFKVTKPGIAMDFSSFI